jgi:hypothetical protein
MGTLDSIHGPVDGIPVRESACDHAEKLFSRGPTLTAPRSDLQTETHGDGDARGRILQTETHGDGDARGDAPPCKHEAAREHGSSKDARRKIRRVGAAGAIVPRVVGDCP